MNDIYLRRKNRLLVESESSKPYDNKHCIATILFNLQLIGYTLSEDLLEALQYLSTDSLLRLHKALIKPLTKSIGFHIKHSPMYINFPTEVMEADDAILYLNAYIHYISQGTLRPYQVKKQRYKLKDINKLKMIELGNIEDFNNIFLNLLKSGSSISETDRSDIKRFIEKIGKDSINYMPDEFLHKEVMAYTIALLINGDYVVYEDISYYINTSTDVLRTAVAMSNGDISLGQNTHFVSFKRRHRRLLLRLLDSCSNLDEDMNRYRSEWIRLGERLHPGEYNYVNLNKTFKKIRNNIQIESFNSKVQNALDNNHLNAVLELLVIRPGEFGRRLDHLLVKFEENDDIVTSFESIAMHIPTTILLQMYTHFKNRNAPKDIRAFFPKGNAAKLYCIDNAQKSISKTTLHKVINICKSAILSEFRKRDGLGKTYVDEDLSNYIVPFSQRSANKSLVTYPRGSKIRFDSNMRTIRPFLYWKEPHKDRTDLDLSAVMYDDKWNYIEHLSYSNLKSSNYTACHSGDIVSAPNGASEFIDIDIDSVLLYGARYIVISVLSYTGQTFDILDECFVGWMSRKYPESGEIYEPTTVRNKINIRNTSKCVIPIVLDLYEDRIIYTDISLSASSLRWGNNVESNMMSMSLIGRAMSDLVKPNLYDLFSLHMEARGTRCYNINEADTVFCVDQGIKPTDIDIIVSEFI